MMNEKKVLEVLAHNFSIKPFRSHGNGNFRDLVSLIPSINREVLQTTCLLQQFSTSWWNTMKQQSVWRELLAVLNFRGINNPRTEALSSSGSRKFLNKLAEISVETRLLLAWHLTSYRRTMRCLNEDSEQKSKFPDHVHWSLSHVHGPRSIRSHIHRPCSHRSYRLVETCTFIWYNHCLLLFPLLT